jgi:hypothetical protein
VAAAALLQRGHMRVCLHALYAQTQCSYPKPLLTVQNCMQIPCIPTYAAAGVGGCNTIQPAACITLARCTGLRCPPDLCPVATCTAGKVRRADSFSVSGLACACT